MHFAVQVPVIALGMLLRVAVLGALCGFAALLFCDTLHLFEKEMERFFPNAYVRAAVGGAALLGLSLLFPSGDYNGTGAAVIFRAVEQGQAKPFAFLLKILFTSITLSAGFKGGEVIPSFFIGACFGCTVGPLLGIPAGFAAAVGLISVFCGAVNCPIASLILSIELFGSAYLVYFAIACAISYTLSGYVGLYSSQKIVYSKIKAEFIDIYAK
jgi:H+/Cl- antiporter ClcA